MAKWGTFKWGQGYWGGDAYLIPVTDRKATTTQYTYVDLNRVEHNTQYLSNELAKYGYTTNIVTKADWALGDQPNQSDITRYLSNITNLVDVFCKLAAMPDLPDNLNYLTCQTANDIENVLTVLEEKLRVFSEETLYCGGFYCGDNIQTQLFTGVI